MIMFRFLSALGGLFAAIGLLALAKGKAAPISDKKLVKTIRFAANLLYETSQARPIHGRKDFTVAQYREVIFSSDHWVRFEPGFDSPYALLNVDFEKFNDLRKVVCHFRRGVAPRDTERLRRFRDRLLYNRRMYYRTMNSKNVKSQFVLKPK